MPFTFWQIMLMAEGKRLEEWNQTAAICMVIANANRDPKQRHRPFIYEDFHPYIKKRTQKRKATESDLNLMRGVMEQVR